MLPAQPPDPDSDPDPHRAGLAPPRADLSIVTDPTDENEESMLLEPELVRSLVIGALLGFVLVFALVGGGLLLADVDPLVSILSAGFVGAFGGVGFGAMEGAALHRPRVATDPRRVRRWSRASRRRTSP